MKIAILNDTHCGVRNASEIYLQNAEKFYKDIFFPKLEKEGIKHILHLGDYYDHRKFVNFKALTHSRKCFLNVLREKHITINNCNCKRCSCCGTCDLYDAYSI